MSLRAPYAHVDAFAERPFTGNPAAVLRLDTWPGDATMRRIAAETGLPATAFLVPDPEGAADQAIRWFTPRMELAMCGHGALASGHVLLRDDPARAQVRFATRSAGILRVTRDGDGYAMDLPAKPAKPAPLPDIVAALGPRRVAETLWHDEGYGVVVLADAAEVRATRPDFRLLAALGNYLTIVTAPGDDADVVSRAFGPASGIDEDPATGSAHAVITPYWAARLGRPAFTALQASARTARLGCRLEGERVILTGRCVTVIEGVLSA